MITYLIGAFCGAVIGGAASAAGIGGARLALERRSKAADHGFGQAVATLVERSQEQEKQLKLLDGQLTKALADTVLRFDEIDQAMKELIRREEVEAAFAEVAKIEAARAQQAQQLQALQQAQQLQVAPVAAPAGFAVTAQVPRADLNARINDQLAALNARLGDLGEQFGRP